VGNDHDAQDAVQEALIAIARGIRRFDGRSAFTTWSYRVATNACLDELRRRRRRPLPGAFGAGDMAAPVPGAAAGVPRDALDGHGGPRPAFGPGDEPGAAAIDAVGERLDVDAALARIPYDFRVAVVLRDLCDLDYAEIGRILDLPAGTVRSRIARGRGQLADLLGNRDTPTERPTPTP
jgi:RNA polymerase sigma-70 factor (ECF subfamily)